MPSNPYLPQPAAVVAVRQESHDTRTLTLELPERIDFAPGQFNMLSLLGQGEGPFSITSAPDGGNRLEHTIRSVGSLTGRLNRLQSGDRLELRGPYGRGWPLEALADRDLLIVAGGVGLAPLRGVIHLFLGQRRGGSLEVLYGCRRPQDLIYTAELAAWQEAGARLLFTVDEVPGGSDWSHGTGMVTNLIGSSRVDFAGALAFVCGPEIMMRFVARSLAMRGLPEENIFVSLERRMECGLGQCGRCMIGPRYVCSDGPVFSYPEAKALRQSLLAAEL